MTDWSSMLERSCAAVAGMFRTPDPIVFLAPRLALLPIEVVRWSVEQK